MENENKPVMLVTTKEGLWLRAGEPEGMADKVKGWIKKGYQINTIPISEYRERVKTAKWVYENN